MDRKIFPVDAYLNPLMHFGHLNCRCQHVRHSLGWLAIELRDNVARILVNDASKWLLAPRLINLPQPPKRFHYWSQRYVPRLRVAQPTRAEYQDIAWWAVRNLPNNAPAWWDHTHLRRWLHRHGSTGHHRAEPDCCLHLASHSETAYLLVGVS